MFDPEYERELSEKDLETRKLKQSVLWPALFTAALWAVEIAKHAFELELWKYGVRPGDWWGLTGILTGPLIHGGFKHLFNNSVPLIVSGAGILYLYRAFAARVFIIVYLLSGLAVWLFARPSSHIGASGLTYGFVCFIFFSGVFRREAPAIALALIVTFLYGGMAWGVFPIQEGVSWESHLAGAVIGFTLAFAFRKSNLPPPPDWGDDDDDEDYYIYERER